MRRLYLLLLPLLTSSIDSCGFSCRYRSAERMPSYMVPLSLSKCTAKNPIKHCSMRNSTPPAASITVHRPSLYVAMTTIPPRANNLQYAVGSLYRQRRKPDGVILSASAVYKRFPGQIANLSALDLTSHAHVYGEAAMNMRVERLNTCEDNGPGTKLLCALPRLRAIASGYAEDTFAVLLDDDLKYKPWALQWLERAITDDPNKARHAYSYDVYTITPEGRAVTGGLYKGLLVGAGHALFALRLSKLEGIEDFFTCVRKLEPRATYHDDVIISMFMQDVRKQPIYRITGTPYEIASKSFPDVHETTVSFLSPGALIRLAHDAQALVANSSKGVGGRRLSKKRAHGGETGAGGGGGGAAATSALVGILEGGADILRNVSTVDQARQFFSRSAVTLAMGQVRLRILTEGLCGVKPNASASATCVGDWCKHKGPWGTGIAHVEGGKAQAKDFKVVINEDGSPG